ncbi:MAG: hypothetical protein AAB421_01735 [Patescibacteria group bacterium]
MATWLKTILKEISDVDTDKFNPPAEFGEKDTVIGTIEDDETRGLWVVSVDYRKRAVEKIASVMLASSSADRATGSKEAKILHIQAEVLSDMFWTSVRHQFEKARFEPSIGIRKGWVVVSSEPEPERNIGIHVMGGNGIPPEILAALLQGIEDPDEAPPSRTRRKAN